MGGFCDICVNQSVSIQATLADNYLTRLIGLIRCKSDEAPSPMWFPSCSRVHMMWMRVPLDIVQLSGDGFGRCSVVRTDTVRPWGKVPHDHACRSVLELPAGTCEKSGIRKGDTVDIDKAHADNGGHDMGRVSNARPASDISNTLKIGVSLLTLVALLAMALGVFVYCASPAVAARVGNASILESDVTERIMGIVDTEADGDMDRWAIWLSESGSSPAQLRYQTIDSMIADKQAELCGASEMGAYEASDSEMEAWVRDNASILVGARHVRAIVFTQDEVSDAKSASDRIARSASTFDEVCTERMGSPVTGDLGWTGISGIDPEVESAVASAEKGVPTGLIECTTGSYAIALWDDELTTADYVPQNLKKTISGIISSLKSAGGRSSALDDAYRNLQVTVYPMPKGLPYDL